jgi:hypothetical protein
VGTCIIFPYALLPTEPNYLKRKKIHNPLLESLDFSYTE